MCINYKKLNKVTIKKNYPLPRIDDLFHQLIGLTIFLSIDLRFFYHQVAVKVEHIECTAFWTRYEYFEFPLMPFGMMNSFATFMDLMNWVFSQFLNKFVVVFIDDVMIYLPTLEDHA